jgi:hypothetical protein
VRLDIHHTSLRADSEVPEGRTGVRSRIGSMGVRWTGEDFSLGSLTRLLSSTGLQCPHRHGLEVWGTSEHGFDVNDRRAVNDFDRADPQPVLGDSPDGDAMKAQRIWSVRRTRRKDPVSGRRRSERG